MNNMNVRVVYWILKPSGSDGFISNYSCWVYCDDRDTFLEWMKQNMTGEYEAIPRFNSGNPMITVSIIEEVDAAIFKLCWNVV